MCSEITDVFAVG